MTAVDKHRLTQRELTDRTFFFNGAWRDTPPHAQSWSSSTQAEGGNSKYVRKAGSSSTAVALQFLNASWTRSYKGKQWCLRTPTIHKDESNECNLIPCFGSYSSCYLSLRAAVGSKANASWHDCHPQNAIPDGSLNYLHELGLCCMPLAVLEHTAHIWRLQPWIK